MRITILDSLAMELMLVNTTEDRPSLQCLGQVPITSKAAEQETLSFKIPPVVRDPANSTN